MGSSSGLASSCGEGLLLSALGSFPVKDFLSDRARCFGGTHIVRVEMD